MALLTRFWSIGVLDMAAAAQSSVLGSTCISYSSIHQDLARASPSICPASCCVRNIWVVHLTNLGRNLNGSPRANNLNGTGRGGVSYERGAQIIVQGRSGRSVLYGDAETYVLMEPGEDEQFVTVQELQEKLMTWLQEWPGDELPIDLAKFRSLEEAVQYLLNSVCELDLGDGQGSIQWYEVRLD